MDAKVAKVLALAKPSCQRGHCRSISLCFIRKKVSAFFERNKKQPYLKTLKLKMKWEKMPYYVTVQRVWCNASWQIATTSSWERPCCMWLWDIFTLRMVQARLCDGLPSGCFEDVPTNDESCEDF
jgi:hypothetical protein